MKETRNSNNNRIKTVAWWVWSAWIVSSGSPRFIYGCAAQSHRDPKWLDDQTIDVAGQRLTICQALINDADFQRIKFELHRGWICLDKIRPGAKSGQRVVASRQVFQEVLGHGRARSELYYTLPNIEKWEGDEEVISSILVELQRELNLPFTGRYSSHLGNFEIFHLSYWLEMDPPILCEFLRMDSRNPDQSATLEICRNSELLEETQIAHLISRNDGDIIDDRLIELPSNKARLPVVLPEDPDSFELWVFNLDADKNLIFYENSNFIRQISFVMSVPGATLDIQDKLSDRARQIRSPGSGQISEVTSTSSNRSLVGGPPDGSWRSYTKKMREFSDEAFPKSSEDKWFPKGIHGEVGAILHLNKMLNAGAVRRAILADPWFGSDSVERLLLRLTSQDLDIHIVTSWASTDPDTDIPLPSGDKSTVALENSLKKVRHVLNPKVTVSNMVKKGRQAFHDRYIVIYPHEGPTKTFLLSNSINKMAGNWPFAMSLLSTSAGLEVRTYVEGICRGDDIAKERQLHETMRWSSNEK
jgi:hypothetical protein